MATIDEWQVEIDKVDDNDLEKIGQALEALSRWGFFEKEFVGVATIREMVNQEGSLRATDSEL